MGVEWGCCFGIGAMDEQPVQAYLASDSRTLGLSQWGRKNALSVWLDGAGDYQWTLGGQWGAAARGSPTAIAPLRQPRRPVSDLSKFRDLFLIDKQYPAYLTTGSLNASSLLQPTKQCGFDPKMTKER